MILSAMKKNGIRRGLSASINALSGAPNGLMNILFILIWMNGCWGCVHGYWAAELNTKKKKTQKNMLNRNIQAGQNYSEPG